MHSVLSGSYALSLSSSFWKPILVVLMEILQQGRHSILYDISVNIAYIGTTLTSLNKGDMWFYSITSKYERFFIEDKSSILIFQNDINNSLEPHFFLLYEVAQNYMIFQSISHVMSNMNIYINKYSIHLFFGLGVLLIFH